MEPQLWITALLNRLLAGPVLGLMNLLRIQPSEPLHPITNFVAMQLVVFMVLMVFFLIVRSGLSVETPSGLQHVMETIHTFVQEQSHEIIGHGSERFTPFLVALGLFILSSNLIGMIPSLESPTANAAVPLGCAIIAFAYYHWKGIRAQGPLGYAKHFMGPLPILAPLMIPIEIISHLARVLSLTIRLYANIFAGDMVTLVFFSLVPLGVPVLFLGLHVGVSLLQAYIFVLLTTVYLSGAVSHEH